MVSDTATAADQLRRTRTTFGLSQSRLARLSGVSRFKICTYELGDGSLTPEQQVYIRKALQAEAERLRSIPAQIDFSELQFGREGQLDAIQTNRSAAAN